MSMKWIRDAYHVPAKRGMRVMANGEMGKILSSSGAYLRVKLDMHRKPELFHPTWHMTYFTDKEPRVFRGSSEIQDECENREGKDE